MCHKNIDETIAEWNLLHTVQLNNDISSTEKYWVEISLVTNAAGKQRFGNISRLVLALLSLPLSNASVERTFSIINIIKDKLRNRLSIVMAQAILYIRIMMDVRSCNFIPSNKMLKRFNTEMMYELSEPEVEANVLSIFPIETE